MELAEGTDLLLAEATYADRVADDAAACLNSAPEVGRQAVRAVVERLVLTHLQPGTDPVGSRDAARSFDGWIGSAVGGLSVGVA